MYSSRNCILISYEHRSGKDTKMLERAEEYGTLKALTKQITPKQVQDTVEELLQSRPTGGWDNVKD